MHRRLLPGDYTEYLKVQRIHRISLPRPERRGDKFASILQKLSEKESRVLIPSCAHRHFPSFRRGRWRLPFVFYYISVKQIVTKAFAELVTPVPQKTIVFRIKLLTFANREQKSANNNQPTPTSTAPPGLPERRGVQIARLPQKVSEVSARMLRDKRS